MRNELNTGNRPAGLTHSTQTLSPINAEDMEPLWVHDGGETGTDPDWAAPLLERSPLSAFNPAQFLGVKGDSPTKGIGPVTRLKSLI